MAQFLTSIKTVSTTHATPASIYNPDYNFYTLTCIHTVNYLQVVVSYCGLRTYLQTMNEARGEQGDMESNRCLCLPAIYIDLIINCLQIAFLYINKSTLHFYCTTYGNLDFVPQQTMY